MTRPSKPRVKKDQVDRFRPIEPRNDKQRLLIKSIFENDFTLTEGCAGVGKSRVCSAVGAQFLHDGLVKKIVLTRPIVAAEDIGYLPGDPEKKIHPYLLPLYDELGYYMNVENEIKAKRVSIEPLAYLRGRTLKDSFIILDEAQNATFKQILLFISRIGEGSRMVLNGDLSQIDLHPGQSGFQKMIEIMRTVKEPGIAGVVEFTRDEIVRHPSLIKVLGAIDAYDCKL